MATNGHSGHPLKWFKDQNAARHAWECAICLQVLCDPVQVLDCGHHFCALCIDDILKTDPRCPSCRIEISKAMIFEDHAARRLIKQLEVNCCNEGCSWQGCLSSLLQDHQNSCNFSIRSGDNVRQLDVEKLEQKLETLLLKISSLEKKHEEDTKQVKLDTKQVKLDTKEVKLDTEHLRLKYEKDIKELTLKHENQMKQVKAQLTLQHKKDLKQVQSKHDKDVMGLGQKIEVLQAIVGAHAPQRPLPQQEPEADYTLKIANFSTKLARAKSDNDYGVIESEPFITSHGYKMKVLVNINQAPSGYAGYMCVYIILMKSDRDGTLAWPFTKRCTFVFVDQQDDLSQRQNVKKGFVPNGGEEFKRPTQRQNNKGRGYQNFVKHSTLRTRQYIEDDTVYIKIFVDP